eukprot:277330-Pleurochrysis_carterae.AAC.1
MDVPSTSTVNYETDAAFTVPQVPTSSLGFASRATGDQHLSVSCHRSRHVRGCRCYCGHRRGRH